MVTCEFSIIIIFFYVEKDTAKNTLIDCNVKKIVIY